MPVIINELVVRGTIEAPPPRGGPGPIAAQDGVGAMTAEERAALIAAIVEEVLRALDRMKER